MGKIPHKLRWWIALIADLLVLIPSGLQTGFWRVLDGINAWTYLFFVACLGLFALGISWYIEHLNRRLLTLNTSLTDKIKTLETKLPPIPTPQTDYELTASLRNELQQFLDELTKEPKPDFKLAHDDFSRQLESMGAFGRQIKYGFQLRLASRIKTLGYRLGERNIDEGLIQMTTQQPKDLASLIAIRDYLSELMRDLKSKS
jgi:hypothetical protein